MTGPWTLFPRPIPESDPEMLAADAIRSLSQDDRRGLLRYLLAEWVKDQQRAEARRVEQAGDRAARNERRNYLAKVSRLRESDPAEYHRRYTIAGAIETFEQEIRQEVRLEITAELLGTSFALGNGHSVTWGEATVEDHQLRLQMLTANVLGNFETMHLHEQAISLIQKQGVSRLADAQAVAA